MENKKNLEKNADEFDFRIYTNTQVINGMGREIRRKTKKIIYLFTPFRHHRSQS